MCSHRIDAQGKNRYLGTFDSEKDAACAYTHTTLQMYGEEALAGSANGRAQLKKTMYPGTVVIPAHLTGKSDTYF
jgi:hypothetical protein